MKSFDLFTCPLEGVNLIEASAGTGKTYALAGLFLRFILEKKIIAKQILVITFTNAATAELKSRIRRMIVDARSAFLSGESSNVFISQLLGKYPDPETRQSIIQQLNETLANYDETAIYTIHGFCQRVLSDNAFAGGLPFDMEFIADQKSMEKEFVEDFWRKHFYDNHPVIVRYALARGLTFENLLGLLRLALTRPDMKIIPEDTLFARDMFERELEKLNTNYALFKSQWFKEKENIAKLLQGKTLSGVAYGKRVDGILKDVDNVLLHQEIPIPMRPCIVKLSASELQRMTNKNQKTPSHDIFDLCRILSDQAGAISEMLDRYLMDLKKEFLESVKVDFPDLKKKKNILYFDDLLNRVYEAVRGPEGERLADTLRKQFCTVLVDEFQDTDPVQYAIMQSVFMKKDDRNDHTIFYIGDPKQAIYSFRGADIHAYLRAQKSVYERYTMTSNWRSEQTLITALNVLFGKPSKAFVYDDIGYTPVGRPCELKTELLRIEGEDAAGLHWWFIPARDDGKPIGVTDARSRIISAVVCEISRLLKAGCEKKALIGEKQILANDIAILVKKNSEAVAFKNALRNAGIPSVVYSSESVYLSDQAQDIRRLMLGIIYCENEGYLLSALNTPVFAYSADEIAACAADDDHFESVRMEFKHLNEIWRQKGFLTMFAGLLEQESVRVRIASQPEGERRLTNYSHLAQLLSRLQKEGHLQPLDLLNKLEEMMAGEDNKMEDQQQKLETDRDCIRIVTVHRSKGLEYQVVFCPFAWERGKRQDKKMPVFFHDEANFWQPVADLGSERLAENVVKAETELLAEDCRLLYVALTRAKKRCYFISGNISESRSGAVHYLFHRELYENENKTPDNSDMLEDIQTFALEAPSDIKVKSLEDVGGLTRFIPDKKGGKMSHREFKGTINHGWKIASYTYLSKSGQDDTEWDEDFQMRPFPELNETERSEDSILFFPPGATSGTLLHEILEKVNFTRVSDDATKSIIKDTLNKFNYSERWREPIHNMLQMLVNKDLKQPGGGEFRLSQIGPDSCRKEMEFYFPLRDIDTRKVISVLDRQERIRGIGREIKEKRKISISNVKGFLKGFIDLVFEYGGRYYLSDWKSNNLGERDKCYAPEMMQSEILGSFYDLQYMIYTVALNQYLKKRIPDYSYEKHFGGVYYFFLRGIGPMSGSTDNGVYFDRPEQKLIDMMVEVMLDQSQNG